MFLSPKALSTRAAFTLTELVAVILLIAVMVALVFAVMGSARGTSEKMKCLSRIQNLGKIALLYAAEHQNNMVPLRRDPVGDPPGYWYDHLHEYVGRQRGRSGRYEGGVISHYPGFACPEAGSRYAINRLCGYAKGTTGEPPGYLKLGQGFSSGRVIELPGGVAKSAWFTCPRNTSSEYFLPENYRNGVNHFIGFPHSGTMNVVFMDGHVENLPDPQFAQSPESLREERWIQFFGKAP